eukprot:2039109-Rhodomonas_salina.1
MSQTLVHTTKGKRTPALVEDRQNAPDAPQNPDTANAVTLFNRMHKLFLQADEEAVAFQRCATELQRRLKVQRNFRRKLECRALALRTTNEQLTAANAALAQTARRG